MQTYNFYVKAPYPIGWWASIRNWANENQIKFIDITMKWRSTGMRTAVVIRATDAQIIQFKLMFGEWVE